MCVRVGNNTHINIHKHRHTCLLAHKHEWVSTERSECDRVCLLYNTHIMFLSQLSNYPGITSIFIHSSLCVQLVYTTAIMCPFTIDGYMVVCHVPSWCQSRGRYQTIPIHGFCCFPYSGISAMHHNLIDQCPPRNILYLVSNTDTHGHSHVLLLKPWRRLVSLHARA